MWGNKFILQKENDKMSVDVAIVNDLIENSKYSLSKLFCSLENMDGLIIPNSMVNFKEYTPIGTLDFVRRYLNLVYGITDINPIEIPKPLRTSEFLKRDYKIVKGEDVPEDGKYFIKDASVLKSFSYQGYLKYLQKSDINKNHLYVLSEYVNIKAEYRVYVFEQAIETICQYNGSNLSLYTKEESPDIALINKMVMLLSVMESFPKSYSIDVMVTDRGTSVIEVHPFISVGLYATLWGNNLLQAYKDGIDYVVKYNMKLEPFEVKY